MRGVDLLDQKTGYHFPKLKILKWWRRLFFYSMQVALVDSYIFAKSACPDVSQRYPNLSKYQEAVATDLIGTHRGGRKRKLNPQTVPNTNIHSIKKKFRSSILKKCEESIKIDVKQSRINLC